MIVAILGIGIIIGIGVLVYPWYVHVVGTRYAKDISNVFSSGDISQVDKFLNKSTVIAVRDRNAEDKDIFDEILYEDSRQYIKKEIESENFYVGSSYGYIGYDSRYASHQTVGIYWAIGKNRMVDVKMYLKRKCIFWYSIERIEILESDGYCKRMFLGE